MLQIELLHSERHEWQVESIFPLGSGQRLDKRRANRNPCEGRPRQALRVMDKGEEICAGKRLPYLSDDSFSSPESLEPLENATYSGF